MAGTYFPVDLPPGYQNNGTTYQAKNRWHAGNFVRFFQGNIQPIGGWVKRTLTGTISGVPNAAVSWTDNNGAVWLAVGTTTHLYVLDSANVVWDITPTAIFAGDQPYDWQLANFGGYLVAGYAGKYETVMNWFFWENDPGTPAGGTPDALAITEAPWAIHGLMVTPERFLVLLQGADPTGAYYATGGDPRDVAAIA